MPLRRARILRSWLLVLFLWQLPSIAFPQGAAAPPDPELCHAPWADSLVDWDPAGIQGTGGWTQGYYERSLDRDASYDAGDFVAFDRSFHWRGNFWRLANEEDVGVQIGGPPALGRPRGTNRAPGEERWAIRRWTSDREGPADLEWSLLVDSASVGTGVTVRLFHNGVELDAAAADAGDRLGVERSVTAVLAAGDVLDLALTPAGTDGERDDLGDDASFRLRVLPAAGTPVGEPDGVVGLDAPEAIAPFLDGLLPETTPSESGGYELVNAFPALSFTDPVRIVRSHAASTRLHVLEKPGRIVSFEEVPDASELTVFLDIRERVQVAGDCGALGLVFHPDYAVEGSPHRGELFLRYQYSAEPVAPVGEDATPSYFRLSRFRVPEGSAVADPDSEEVLIQQFDRDTLHQGGDLFFGADGFLYVAVGDEGGADDEFETTQRLDDRLFSGVLRLDVDRDPLASHAIRRQPQSIARPAGWPESFTQGYSIPNDNPWLDPEGGRLEEFFALGLRSPHAMHFDSLDGEIWLGDVGQSRREELSLVTAGANLQWPYREGHAAGPIARPSELLGIDTPPLWDYPRSEGSCVIGGLVYRGARFFSLWGQYIFGDHTSGKIWALARDEENRPSLTYLATFFRSTDKAGLASFAEGSEGDLYLAGLNGTNDPGGRILKLVATPPVPEPPARLSETGVFEDLASLRPRRGLIPYDLETPFWSDGALKSRWLAVPNDGTHDMPCETVGFSRSEWDFPTGTVFVKHFELPADDSEPGLTFRLETRFLVHGSDGNYYGLTYRWLEDESDALLLTSDERVDFTVLRDGVEVEQRWLFPSREDCLRCHNQNSGQVLGVKTHNLNGELLYPRSGRSANQLRTLGALGILGRGFSEDELESLPRGAPLGDETASLTTRARAWLDSNCSSCHRPGGVSALFDARFETPLEDAGLIDGPVLRGLGLEDPRVIVPGDLERSLLYFRASRTGALGMPPLAKELVDEPALAVLERWIEELGETSGRAFRRGDVDQDGRLVLTDAVGILLYLFRGALIACESSADADDNGRVNLTDAVAVLLHLFQGAGPLPEPFGVCGLDPSPDALGCESSGCP